MLSIKRRLFSTIREHKIYMGTTTMCKLRYGSFLKSKRVSRDKIKLIVKKKRGEYYFTGFRGFFVVDFFEDVALTTDSLSTGWRDGLLSIGWTDDSLLTG